MLLPSITIAFFVTMIFMIALRPFATSVGLLDRPGGRKRHVGDVPIIGGIAIFLGLAFGLSVLPAAYPYIVYLGIAGGLLVVIGVIDDKYNLPPSIRLITQIVAVLIMVFGADLRLENIGNPFGFGVIHLGPFSLIFTILITISILNAFNLVDGVDGLAGTLAVLALSACAVIGGYQSPMSLIALVAAASIAGFLFFNLPMQHNRRVRSFMGDAGSTFVGFIIAWVLLSGSQGVGATVSPVIFLWFVALPVFDLFTCFVKRSLKGYSPFRPGRDHFHHILARGGMSAPVVLCVLGGIQLLYVGVGLIGHYLGVSDVVMFTAWSFFGVSQHWIIEKYSALCRLSHRKRRARQTPVTYP